MLLPLLVDPQNASGVMMVRAFEALSFAILGPICDGSKTSGCCVDPPIPAAFTVHDLSLSQRTLRLFDNPELAPSVHQHSTLDCFVSLRSTVCAQDFRKCSTLGYREPVQLAEVVFTELLCQTCLGKVLAPFASCSEK